jgi:Glycosyl hydrolase family 26/Bacterial Ig domain
VSGHVKFLALILALSPLVLASAATAERPRIRTIKPVNGSTVTGVVRWEARARPKPRRVNFFVDGVRRKTDRRSPYVYSWDTTRARNGVHRLTVRGVWRRLTRSSTIRIAVSNARPRPSYPASYFTGPARANNVLPPKAGTFLGVFPGQPGWNEAQKRQDLLALEAYIGRRVDIDQGHYAAPNGGCYWEAPFSRGTEAWDYRNGRLPMISWSPGYTLDQVNAGEADACFRDVARRFKAFTKPVLWRLWWEFNIVPGFVWAGTGQRFIDAWRRVVKLFKDEGVTNAIFVWCPHEPHNIRGSYPGDEYVDWVCADGYNWNSANAWCGAHDNPHPGWCWFDEIFHDISNENVHDVYGPQKPVIIGESGSAEDPRIPSRKRDWFLRARDRVKSDFRYMYGFVYFHMNVCAFEAHTANCNWRIDTSRASLDGFKELALDRHFRTRS